MPIFGQYIGKRTEAKFPLKANDTSDKSININSRSTANISTAVGIHGESNGSFHFSNSSYLRSSVFNSLYGNFKSAPYTVCFWIYPTSKTYTNSNMNIIGGWNGSYYSGVWLRYLTNTNKVGLLYYSGSYNEITLSKTLSFNNWYFLHFSMANGYRRVGVDEDYIDSTDATPDISPVSGTAGIGANCGPNNTNSGFHYNGRIMGIQAFYGILNLGELEIIRNQKGKIRI